VARNRNGTGNRRTVSQTIRRHRLPVQELNTDRGWAATRERQLTLKLAGLPQQLRGCVDAVPPVT
jgi:hypothetical protein